MPHSPKLPNNQRQFTRAAVELKAEIRLDCGMLIEGHTRDISLCGALLTTERSLPRGHPVRVILNFTLDGEPYRVRTQGYVARVDDAGIAVAIQQIHPESLPPLCRIILEHTDCPEEAEKEMAHHETILARELLITSYK